MTIGNGGIELATGANTVNQYRFDNGAYTRAYSTDGIILQAPGQIWLQLNGGALVTMDSTLFAPSNNTNSNLDLGGGSSREWRDFYLDRDFYWNTPPSTASADYPMVWSSVAKALLYKSDAVDCSSATSVTAENGIITGCSDPITPEIQALRAEVADLKAQLAALVAMLGGR